MAEPVTIEIVRQQHLRLLDDDSHDALVEAYIEAARVWVENYTGHVLAQREFTERRDSFSRYIELRRTPVLASPAPIVSYTDTDGETQVYADCVYSLNGNPARIYPAPDGWWPTLRRNGNVTITYFAGYNPGEEPMPLVQAILLLVGHWWEQRSAVAVGATVADVPFAVAALCDQYRTPVL